MSPNSEITGWRRFFHLKFRFGLAKLPLFPARYRLCTDGLPDTFFRWTRVMPFMDPVRGAFDFALYGWDVRELRFLRRFLRPGMTFADIGAHHGLYAVLAAQQVGDTGRVLAFEPSPACFRRLRWHARLNGAGAVELFSHGVGARDGRATLYVPTQGIDTVSSLRPTGVTPSPMRRVEIDLVALDTVAATRGLRALDLVKLDVEGAEAEVLEGAGRVLGELRPLWLFEALDSTAGAWGSSARALVERFGALGHELFEYTPEGYLRPHTVRAEYPLDSNCNLLAVPIPLLDRVTALIADGNSAR